MNCSSIKKEDCVSSSNTISHQSNYKRIPRSKAIRLKCLDCCAYQYLEVKQCTSYDCPLWRYRMGKEERDEVYYQSKANNYEEEYE